MNVLDVLDVHASRGRQTVLSGVSLNLPTGSITALLGPNGSGKTTLMRVLAGLLTPNRGQIRSPGIGDPTTAHWRRHVAYVPTGGTFLEQETGHAHFAFGARAYPAWSQSHALEAAHELHVPLQARASRLSTGQRMGLALAYAFGCRAPVLLLDEPSNGLDPEHRALLARAVALFAADGGTVLLSSHVLPEIEGLADRGVFLQRGAVKLQADLDDLRAASTTLQVILPDVLPANVLDDLRALPGVKGMGLDGRTLSLHLSGAHGPVLAALQTLRPLDIQSRPCPLAQTYAELMTASDIRGAA